tara:strand:+ start:9155 stop:10405 length:1251 start_codon:yes stop_codon:yes gene_type:complete
MKRIVIILIALFSIPNSAQETITLQDCYSLANLNYPLAKQARLLITQNQIDNEVLSIAKLPQLLVEAQATYQSDVIEIPIPNTSITPLSKDQYRATLSVNQLIYNGGEIAAAIQLKSAQLDIKQKQVEVNLYQLKQKINQFYFSILLTQESTRLLQAKQDLLQAKLSEVNSGIKNGIILPISDKILEAELLKIKQQVIALENDKSSFIETLSSIIGTSLNSETKFTTSFVDMSVIRELMRPELELFQLKKEEIMLTETLMSKKNIPKLLGFATGGYGNPGLNMLDNSFQPFYITGIKLNWNVFDWNSNKKQRESLSINKKIIDTESETFKLNTNTALNQQQKEIETIEALISSDNEIIKLRREVLAAADSQFKHGIITSSAYITELTNLYEDENTMLKHTIQLQLAKANYNSIQGN